MGSRKPQNRGGIVSRPIPSRKKDTHARSAVLQTEGVSHGLALACLHAVKTIIEEDIRRIIGAGWDIPSDCLVGWEVVARMIE